MKILLVDDENFILQSLSAKIRDLASPFEVVGTATSFNKCIDLLQTQSPDVIITDICMPGKNGLDLIKFLHTQFPNILIIISSAHHSFDYAKEALTYSVIDYLVKPVSYAHLKSSLDKCLNKLQQLKHYHKLHLASALYQPNSNISSAPLVQEDSFFMLYIIMGNPLNSSYNMIHPCIPYLPNHSLEEFLISSYPDLEFYCFNGLTSNEKLIALKSSTSSLDLFSISTVLNQSLEKQTQFYITSCFSPQTVYLTESHTYSQQLRNYCAQNTILGKSSILSFSKESSSSLQSSIKIGDLNHLLGSIKSPSKKILHSLLTDLFTQLDLHPCSLPYLEHLLIYIFNFIIASFSPTNAIDTSFLVQNIICHAYTLDDLKHAFEELIFQFCLPQTNEELDSSLSQVLITSCEHLMLSNLNENLSLNQICDKLGISSVYLCRLFKKYKATTPINFFISLKIQKSKEYIKTYPNMSFKDISYSLGFSDPYYFSKTFKRLEGISPSQYKDQLSLE